jgi:apolipoprotein N-acyltransferase
MGYDENADEFRLVSSLARGCGATVINGCFYRRGDDEYNALYAVDSSGNVSEPYFKQVLVPFGEKIPLAFLFGASTLCECSDETNTRPLDTALGSIGCVICIESVYPEIVRKQAAQGAQILCVCSNDSWFGGSYARSMHFRHSIMRAAENGRYLLRSGNCGISAIIKPTGEVQSVRTQTSKGVLTGQVNLIDDRTLYSAFKDLFTVLPALLTALAVMRMYTSKKR